MTSRIATSAQRLVHAASTSRASAFASASVRTMATTAARQREFLAVIPDKPGTLQKRLQVRQEHLSNVKPQIDSGEYKMGGGLLNELPASDDPSTWDFAGSTFVVVAETKEQVVADLKKDIYFTSGVWDLDKAQVYPFICAFRNP